jgi:uncharacterized membrane protein (DUF2068 family)
VDWSLAACALRGHVSYAPAEPDLRDRLRTSYAAGEAWRCLRCGSFVPGPPGGTGPATAAPAVRRDTELRSALILRFFAVERFVRVIVFGVIAYAVWRFKYSRNSVEQAFNRELPEVRGLLRGLGFNIDRSSLVGLIRHAFTLNSRTLNLLIAGALALALVELLEGIGLWMLKRWGEYFAMVVTSVGLPYEIYDLTAKVTALRVLAFTINIALIVYLVLTKRLFGARGGKHAYEARLRSASIIDLELAALEQAQAAQKPGNAEPGGTDSTAPGPVSPGQAGGVPRR